MADQNEIGIDLRLKTQKLGQDIASAGNQIKSGLASSVKGLGDTTSEREERAAAAASRRAAIARRQRNERLDLADAIEEASRRNRARALWRQREQQREKAQQSGRIPVSSILAGVSLGVPGLGAIAGLAQLNPAAAIAVGALRTFGAAVQMASRAADEAKRYYARTLQSGFGTGFTINRSLLAKAIGVGEEEVYQYGAAVGALNERMANATKILAETNPALTQLSWNYSVLSADFEAMRSKIAEDLAPAMNSFLNWLDNIAKKITNFVDKGPKHPEMIPGTLEYAEKMQKDLQTANEYAEKTLGHGPGLNPFGKDRKEWNATVVKKLDELTATPYPEAQQAPAPVAFMKQMKASSWERMGLIIGSGGGTNYNKNTAENTKKANELLAKMPAEIAAAFTRYMSFNVNNNIPQIP